MSYKVGPTTKAIVNRKHSIFATISRSIKIQLYCHIGNKMSKCKYNNNVEERKSHRCCANYNKSKQDNNQNK